MSNFDKYIFKQTDYYSARITRICSGFLALSLKKIKIIPEFIVIVGLLIGLLSAYLYSFGTHPLILFASLLFLLAWFLDFVDGDLARVSNKVTEGGEWLDSVSGKIIEMSIYLGICWGLARFYNPVGIWKLGFIIIILHYIIVSIMIKESVLELKSYRDNINPNNTEIINKRKRIGIIRKILHEFTIGPDLNGYIIIIGGIINMLLPALILCLFNNICYLLLRLFTKGRYYFFKTNLH